MTFGALILVDCLWSFERLNWLWGSAHHLCLVLPSPLSVSGQGPDVPALLRAQDCRVFSCSFIFAMLTLFLAQSRGAPRVPCSCITRYGAVRDCVFFFPFSCCICSTFAAKHFFPSRGCRRCQLPFHIFFVSLSLPLHDASHSREVFGATSPLC